MQHPWHQEPSDELDQVWDDLLYGELCGCCVLNQAQCFCRQIIDISFQGLNVRIKQSELDELNINTSNKVKVSGGDADYVGVFGVYHHMHCLNNIRRLINWDYYGSRLSGPEYADAFSVEHSSRFT